VVVSPWSVMSPLSGPGVPTAIRHVPEAGTLTLRWASGSPRIASRGRACKDSLIASNTVDHVEPVTERGPDESTARRPERPLRRSADNAVLGGVCGGLARRLGVSARLLRVLAILSIVPAGLGLLFYMACWTLIPRTGETRSVATRVCDDRRQLQIVLAVATVALAVLITLQALGLQGPGVFAWPLLLSLVGVLCVWRGASDEEREQLQERLDAAPLVNATTSTSWRTIALRACAGGALLLVGVVLLSKIGTLRGAAIGVFFGAVAVCAGFLVLFAPWWLRTLRDLSSERRERVRAQERADVAAHLHDSVLQTLLLIQKSAAEPTEVIRLARNQERELRHWLFDPRASSRAAGSAESFGSLAEAIERDVEDAYGVGVELVVVGDCDVDDAVLAILGAGREAAVNAAKWSGTANFSMFAEVEPTSISIFVRDLGTGFDPSRVPEDRRGIACSIRERMVRYGGTAVVRSTPDVGTEVELVLPRDAASR
jgi:signal transduction histidine kinase